MIAYKRCDKPDRVQFMKSWEKYATSFEAGSSNHTIDLWNEAMRSGGHFKNTYELLNPRALKI